MNALMRQRDLMEFMNISRATLWRIQKHKNFPKPVILLGCKRWRREDVETWLEGKKEEPKVIDPASTTGI
jgi:predicted DNA-binding transcriptional regulator AlpA